MIMGFTIYPKNNTNKKKLKVGKKVGEGAKQSKALSSWKIQGSRFFFHNS